MDSKMLFSLMICYILAHDFRIQGMILTKEEDLELDKQLLIKNKPFVKTITTEFGDIYDCVDFYKQPAFDHPLLKNHSFNPQMTLNYKKSSEKKSINETLPRILKDGGCPIGSVPIRRTTKADLIREKEYHKRFSSYENSENTHIISVVQTKPMSGPFYGASARAGLYRPYIGMDQFSSFRLRVQNGDDAIQIGWRVDPPLYGDDELRFYTSFRTGKTHCFNTMCPGFVIVNNQYPLDSVFHNYNKIGDQPLVEIGLSLVRDKGNGNWWVQVGNSHIPLGFWPANIFKRLNQEARYVDWGGSVFSPDGVSVIMGLGKIPIDIDVQNNAFCRQIEVMDAEGIANDATTITQIYSTKVPNHGYSTKVPSYGVLEFDHDPDYQHALLYGGS